MSLTPHILNNIRATIHRIDSSRYIQQQIRAGRKPESFRSEVLLSDEEFGRFVKYPLEEVKPGFSGASIREICDRYAVGLLSRDQVIDELQRWPYKPRQTLGWFYESNTDLSSEYLELAYDRRLISEDIYDAVYDSLPEGLR